VANLVALSPGSEFDRFEAGGLALSESTVDQITSVAPFKGQADAVSRAMKAELGIGFPAPGDAFLKGDVQVIWAGRNTAFVMGAAFAPTGAALTDQSDAWAIFRLEGVAAQDVLARLVPIDLRDAAFGEGRTARTMLAHMTCSLTRIGATRYDVMVFRSMAATAWHDLKGAMERVLAEG
jgi:sarcosine oxidase subunit gamma